MEVYVYLGALLIFIGLIWVALRAYKDAGYNEAETEGLEESLDVFKTAKEIDEEFNNLNPAELKRLREQNYRD